MFAGVLTAHKDSAFWNPVANLFFDFVQADRGAKGILPARRRLFSGGNRVYGLQIIF